MIMDPLVVAEFQMVGTNEWKINAGRRYLVLNNMNLAGFIIIEKKTMFIGMLSMDFVSNTFDT